LSVVAAARLGLLLIRLSEQAITNAILNKSLIEKGMGQVEASALVLGFVNERERLRTEEQKAALQKAGAGK
jgi:hypothetical protein